MLRNVRVGWIALGSSVLLLGAILVILHKQQGFASFVDIWRRSDKTAIWLAILAMLGVQLTAALRLRTILSADGLAACRLPSVYRIQLISQFAAHGAPVSALADVARAAMLTLRFGIPIGRAVRLVFYERVCGVLGAAVVGLVATGIQYFRPEPRVLSGVQLLLWGSCLVASAILLSLGGLHLNTKFALFNRLVRAISMLGEMVAVPSLSFKLVIIAAAQIVGFAVVCVILAQGMHIAVSPVTVALYMPLIFFVSSLPIFYLGWGAREAIFIATLGSTGTVSTAEAVALSVALGVIVFLASLPGAVFWLLRPSMRKDLAEAGGALEVPRTPTS
jgi:Lysylphosphatidylglycerol synthase TM region